MDLKIAGLNANKIYRNLSYEELHQHELANKEAAPTTTGALCVDTTPYTGRSPKDKFIVEQHGLTDDVWWGEVNQKISEKSWQVLKARVLDQLNEEDLYVTDCYCGADSDTRLSVRVITELAWQSHFCKNMFIRPDNKDLEGFSADFTILDACRCDAGPDWKELGLNSSTFIVFNLQERMAIIGGTSYGGEMKKGIFSMMNLFLPRQDILSMHCSANIGKNDDTALFFGLSGTGKTTLSADPERSLIGDDEHGWNDNGIFNLEGGCYAKTIKLSAETEPDIFRAIRLNALLENVVLREDGSVNYDDSSKTENTRVSYPIHHIDNIVIPESKGGHPKCVIFLTCDAFGVLPPVARLSPEQAMYYFISGYTAKVAGTERGIKEPTACFSPCFGGPFLSTHPARYAELLGQKLETHNAPVYMINTGWSGGAYGTGERISLPLTRRIVHAALDGELCQGDFHKEKFFGLEIPAEITGVPSEILDPEQSWQDKTAFASQAGKLAKMFHDNYRQYIKPGMDYSQFGP